MAIVVDYSAGRIAPSALKAAGVVGVCRYLSWAGLSKVIHKPEYDELVAAGIRVTLNWEGIGTDWLGGGPAGSDHARQAVAQAQALGYPKGEVIIGSADFDMSRNQWDLAGHAYAVAFANGIRAGGYRPGVYGPYNVLQWVKDAGIMDAFWQAGMSWAWTNNNKVWPGAHLFQHAHLTIAGTDTDYNDILVTPLWGKAPTKGNVMAKIITISDSRHGPNAAYGTGGGSRFWLPGWTKLVEYAAFWGLPTDGFPSMTSAEADLKVGPEQGTSGTPTQEQVNAAFAANVVQFATALAAHFKVS